MEFVALSGYLDFPSRAALRCTSLANNVACGPRSLDAAVRRARLRRLVLGRPRFGELQRAVQPAALALGRLHRLCGPDVGLRRRAVGGARGMQS